MKLRLVLIVLFLGLSCFTSGPLFAEEAAPVVAPAPQASEAAAPACLSNLSSNGQPEFQPMTICTVSVACPQGGYVGCTTQFTNDCGYFRDCTTGVRCGVQCAGFDHICPGETNCWC